MYLVGTEGDDLLVGGADADTLVGLGGDDTLQGGEGDDLLMGGAGENVLNGGSGDDTVSYEDVEPVAPSGYLLVNLLGQYTWVIFSSGGPQDTLVSIENVIGSFGADWLVGTADDNHLSGGAGDDNIEGKGGADVLDGGDGRDLIVSGGFPWAVASGSLMIGGNGDDSIQSGNSNDTMLGGAGNDALSVGNYATTRIVDGGNGTDLLAFSSGFSNGVTVDLSLTTQTIAPGVVLTLTSVENVNGTEVGDTLIGDANANIISGWGGNDVIYGGAGNDTINGVDGADYIVGGAGLDNLRGGDGADTFVFALGDSDAGVPDYILDFTAEDRILFTDGPTGDVSNYVELEAPDMLAVDLLFAGNGVRYVAMAVGGYVYLYGDTGDEGAAYDNIVVLMGANLSAIDASSILGL